MDFCILLCAAFSLLQAMCLVVHWSKLFVLPQHTGNKPTKHALKDAQCRPVLILKEKLISSTDAFAFLMSIFHLNLFSDWRIFLTSLRRCMTLMKSSRSFMFKNLRKNWSCGHAVLFSSRYTIFYVLHTQKDLWLLCPWFTGFMFYINMHLVNSFSH